MQEQNKPEQSIESVVAEIGNIMTEVSVMGFNDYEIPALMKLMDDVKNKKIDPKEALNQAYSIKNQKQDYH